MNNTFDVIRVEEGVYRIETEMVRSWLFLGKEKAMLVDTTATKGDLLGTVSSVTDLPVILVNTHADGDHIACNDQFETAFMHPDEFELYRRSSEEGYAEPKPLADGEKIDLVGREFEVVHIPGHTPGSIALLDRRNRILIAGDTVSESHVFLFGDHRSIPEFKKSLLRLKELSGEYDLIYTSHGKYAVDVSQIDNELICLDECLAGKVAPEEPPFPFPVKMYRSHGAVYLLDL